MIKHKSQIMEEFTRIEKLVKEDQENFRESWLVLCQRVLEANNGIRGCDDKQFFAFVQGCLWAYEKFVIDKVGDVFRE